MSETKTQWFVLYGGLFIPIADNVVRDGFYLVDMGRVDDDLHDGMRHIVGEAYIDGADQLVMSEMFCSHLLRAVSNAGADLEVSVTLST